jgi:hypothetical protein
MGVGLSGVLALFMLGLACWQGSDKVPVNSGPQTLTEVVQAVTDLGLYYCSDRPDGRFDGGRSGRLVVSERPVDFNRATLLKFEAGHSCWDGTVAVTLDPLHAYDGYFLSEREYPGWVARWGEFFVLGDPSLIRRLVEVARVADVQPRTGGKQPGHFFEDVAVR